MDTDENPPTISNPVASGPQGDTEMGGTSEGSSSQKTAEASSLDNDTITAIQDALVSVGKAMTEAADATQQIHAPESAPLPPPGVDPAIHYQEFWRKRYEERPFATRGFEHEEESAKDGNERMQARAAEMFTSIQKIEELISSAAFPTDEAEHLSQLEKLEEENNQAKVELEEAVVRGTAFLRKVADLQCEVAKRALGF